MIRSTLYCTRRLPTSLQSIGCDSRKFCIKGIKTSTATRVTDAISAYIDKKSSRFNVPDSIISKLDRKLHLQSHHPLNIIKNRIEEFCTEYAAKANWPSAVFIGDSDPAQLHIFDNLDPFVTTKQCFDELRVPPDHVSRQSSDTYYLDDSTVLRTHTSAHQCELIKGGSTAFLCSGEVYRRDEIDCTHYPVFHQMEGVRIFDHSEFTDCTDRAAKVKIIERELKHLLSGLASHLFGDVPQRWRDDYFPFTEPSFELEVFFNDDWLEVLGCGVIHEEVMRNALGPTTDKLGWAFGLGLERLAMVLFQIPDIRLFWSMDQRFLSQFHADKLITTFVPYSKFPACYKDVSFWLPEQIADINNFYANDVYEVIREVAGDTVERVELFDTFQHKKTQRFSQAYRIYYRHMDRNLTNEEVDAVQLKVREQLLERLKVSLR